MNALALHNADDGARQDSPDAVHQIRVSLRRMRSALRTFRPMLGRGWTDPLRDEMAWLGRSLGQYRESEVLAERYGALTQPDASGAVALLGDTLRTRLAAGRVRVRSALRADRYLALRRALDDECTQLHIADDARQTAADVLPAYVADEWDVLAARATAVLQAQDTTPASDAAWHRTRIAAKRVRYAVDAVAPALSDAARELAELMSDVTDVLGEHQDAAQAADLAGEVADEMALDADVSAAGAIYSLGVVHRMERDRVAKAREAFGDLWPTVDTPSHTGWFPR